MYNHTKTFLNAFRLMKRLLRRTAYRKQAEITPPNELLFT